MGADLTDPAGVEDVDAVGVPDGREAVGDHQRGPVVGDAGQRALFEVADDDPAVDDAEYWYHKGGKIGSSGC